MSIRAFITEASAHAAVIDRTFALLTVITTAIVLLVFLLLTVFAVRYRRGSSAPRGHLPAWTRRELEVGWTAATFFLFMFIFWWAASSQLSALSPPENALKIFVRAKQWMWKVEQPNGRREINELHVPANQAVRLSMTSEDVIHSLFLPALRIKQDVLPGRTTDLWFTATKPGVYQLQCAELCGTEHSRMTGRLVVMRDSDYVRWAAAGAAPDTAIAGEGAKLFRSFGCSGCHAPQSPVHAPMLDGLFGRRVPLSDGRTVVADEAYIRDSILLPAKDIAAGYAAIMPSYRTIAREDQIDKLVAYIKSIGQGSGRP